MARMQRRPWLHGLALGMLLACLPAGMPAARAQRPFVVWSPTFRHGVAPAQRYDGAGCGGRNVSPRIEWSGLPPRTRSLALAWFDRDARSGAGWWHWAVLDIPAVAQGLAAGAGAADGSGLPPGARQLRNSFGTMGYGGPCPPPGSGPHRYQLTVWALAVRRLVLPPGAGPAQLAARASALAIGTARLQVAYGR